MRPGDRSKRQSLLEKRLMKNIASALLLALCLALPAFAQDTALRAAAERGDAQAQNELSMMYENDCGVANK